MSPIPSFELILSSLEPIFEKPTQLSPLLSKTSQLSTILSKSARLSTFLSAQKSKFTLESPFLSGFTLLSAFLSAQKSAQAMSQLLCWRAQICAKNAYLAIFGIESFFAPTYGPSLGKMISFDYPVQWAVSIYPKTCNSLLLSSKHFN